MRAIIIILILTAVLFAEEKLNDNNDNLKILQKQIEHQLSVKGNAAEAAQNCLAELKTENLTKNQKQVFQKLLKRAATQSRDIKIVREAVSYLTSQNISCDKLIQRLSLGLPENLNTNLNKNIREALEYQWKTINWKKPGTDLEVLNKYLMEIAENTNISQNARAQSIIFIIQINNWHKNKISQELYDRLQIDLQCPREKEVEIRIKKTFDRLYETARHYLTESHALSIGSIVNLCKASEEIPEKYKLNDIFRIQINRFNKQIESIINKYKEMEIEEIENFSDEQINEFSNKIEQLEKPLNEIRKYVYENYEKQLIKNKQKIIENQKSKKVFNKELKIFTEEGPKINKKAMEAKNNLLKLLSKAPDLTLPEFVSFLKKYPKLTEKSLIALWKTTKPKNYNQWWALKVYTDVQEFQEKIYSMQNPELIKQFLDSFLRETKPDLLRFLDNDHPAFKATYYYIKGLANKNISMTNFVPLLATELKRISAGNSMLENYIYFIDDWIPLAFEAEKTELKYTLNTIININDYKFDWQSKARIKLAKGNINSYIKLPERERLRKTIETFVELNRGLRKDAGLSTNTVDWVKKLGLDKPDVGEIYRVKNVLFPKRPIEFINVAGKSLIFRIKGMSQFKKVGEIINFKKKDLYKINNFEKKTTNIFVKAINTTKQKNISEITLTDLKTGEKFTLTIGKANSLKSPEAILFRFADNKEVLVKKGDKVPLNDKFSAEIANINVENQTVTFVSGSETNVLKAVQKKAEPSTKKSEEKVTLNFKNAPVVEVLKYLSDLTGDIVVHSSFVTNKKITVTYHKPVTPKEAKTIILKSLKLEKYFISMEHDKDGKQTIMIEE